MRLNSATIANVALTIACLVFIALGTTQLLQRPPQSNSVAVAQPNPVRLVENSQLSLEGAHIQGSPNARIVLIEFSDFECPFCGRFASETYQKIKTEFVEPGRIRYAFRHFPLSNHRFARAASEAAVCAGRHGRFWEMHDELFANQRALAADNLLTHATNIGLALDDFKLCIGSRAAVDVDRDIQIAERAGISVTPTFMIGEMSKDDTVRVIKRIDGAHGIDVFRSALRGL